MKFRETKYNIGDVVWKMADGKPIAYEILSVQSFICKEKCNSTLVLIQQNKYSLRRYNQPTFATYTESETDLDKNYATSKKELMLKIFGDCLESGIIVK